jgi:hypothetical protein
MNRIKASFSRTVFCLLQVAKEKDRLLQATKEKDQVTMQE